MDTGLSASDVALLNDRNGNNWNDNGFMWIFALLILAGGGFGFGGYGNNGGGFNEATMQRGFDNQSVLNNLNDIGNGICDGFYAANTTMLNGFNNVATQIGQARFEAQNCCCETNRNIDQVRYDGAKNTCEIINSANANTQKIIDTISGNRMADMQNQINQLQLQSALCGVVRYPQAITYTAGYSPFCGCNSCCPTV